MAAPGSVNALGTGQAHVPGLAGVQVPSFGLGLAQPALGHGLVLKQRRLGRQVEPSTKKLKLRSSTGLFDPEWHVYAQMDQDLLLEALNRADPGSWSGVGLSTKTSHDKAAAMALAFDRFDDSLVETHESEAWFTMMAKQYIALGRRLEGKSQAQVLQDGQDLVVQRQAAAMAQHQVQQAQAQAHTLQMQQAQAQAQAFVGNHGFHGFQTLQLTQFHAHVPAPTAAQIQPPAAAQIPDPWDMNEDPNGRFLVRGLGRSRYLSRETSGGANDWRLEHDGTIKSASKHLAIHIIDLLEGQSLTEAWPAGAGASSSSRAAADPGPVLPDIVMPAADAGGSRR